MAIGHWHSGVDPDTMRARSGTQENGKFRRWQCCHRAIVVNRNVQAVALNSFLTGLLIEVGCAWVFIYRLELGMRGAALTRGAIVEQQ